VSNNEESLMPQAAKDRASLEVLDAAKTPRSEKKTIKFILGLAAVGSFVVLLVGLFSFRSGISAPVATEQMATPQATQTQDTSVAEIKTQLEQHTQEKAASSEPHTDQSKADQIHSDQKSEQVPDISSGGQQQKLPVSQSPAAESYHGGEPPLTPAQRRLQGEVVISVAQSPEPIVEEHQSGPLNDSLTGEFYAPGHAKQRVNRRFLLVHGTTIPCVLKTRVVTEYKGLVMCQATKDVYSADGSQVLVDRGSTLFGEQRVAIQQGQSRVFINWTDIETPKGVNVRINSLGTDALGAAGAEAWVDKHTAERFGGAIMLSFIQDMFQTLANRHQSTIVYNNSQQATTDMAAKALDNSINIPPTGYINQGTLMNVLVARDIDMTRVYKEKNNAFTGD